MADGWTYSQWVVGNSRMRAVDPNWPAPGSTIRHSIGVWPLVIDDETVVEKSVPLEELVLHAKGRPFGGARVILRLSDIPDGCRVDDGGVSRQRTRALLPSRLADLAAWPRNRERCGGLARLLSGSNRLSCRTADRLQFGMRARRRRCACPPDTRCVSGPCP